MYILFMGLGKRKRYNFAVKYVTVVDRWHVKVNAFELDLYIACRLAHNPYKWSKGGKQLRVLVICWLLFITDQGNVTFAFRNLLLVFVLYKTTEQSPTP